MKGERLWSNIRKNEKKERICEMGEREEVLRDE